jgi:hypothetical protein
MTTRSGRVRGARITDLAALGDLSRLSHPSDDRDSATVRSLGLPVSRGQVSVFSLFRMPLGAFRPSDQLYVYEEDGRLGGLARVERDPSRDEWTIVELDAVGQQAAGDVRLRLVNQALRDLARRGAVRIHVACSDGGGNVELFMQAGFMSYARERVFVCTAEATAACARAEDPAAADIRPVTPLDAVALNRLYRVATPPPVARLEAYRLVDWERQGSGWPIPRSSLAPILRFADVEAFVLPAPGGGADGTQLAGFVQVGVAKEDQPHYLRVLVEPGCDSLDLIRHGLRVVHERTGHRSSRPGQRHDHEVVCPVRTYESPVDRRLEECGFADIATVTLLMKEAVVRVAEPALVPAIR